MSVIPENYYDPVDDPTQTLRSALHVINKTGWGEAHIVLWRYPTFRIVRVSALDDELAKKEEAWRA